MTTCATANFKNRFAISSESLNRTHSASGGIHPGSPQSSPPKPWANRIAGFAALTTHTQPYFVWLRRLRREYAMRATAAFKMFCASASASSRRAASSSSASFNTFCRNNFSAAWQHSSRNELIWNASNPARPNGKEIFDFFIFIRAPKWVFRVAIHWMPNIGRNLACESARNGGNDPPREPPTPWLRAPERLRFRPPSNPPLILFSPSRGPL